MTDNVFWRLPKGPVISTVLLILLGALAADSASMLLYLRFPSVKFAFFLKHVLFILVGVTLGYLLISIKQKFYLRGWLVVLSNVALFPLLLAVFLFPARNGAHRWIEIGGFTFQPSELAKIVLILTLSYLLINKRTNSWQNFTLIYVTAMVGLVALEPDIGTAFFLLVLGSFLMLLGRLSFKKLLRWGGLLLLLIGVLVLFTDKGRHVRRRVKDFFSKKEETKVVSTQAYQALVALGSGGLTGSSPGESLEKFFYLPEAHSDYIFSILGEELGFVGTSAVVFLFLLLLYSGFSAATYLNNPHASLIAYGVTFSLVFQALINITVNVGLFPTKGMPLPFMSYGGTAMVSALLQVSLLIHLWVWRRENDT